MTYHQLVTVHQLVNNHQTLDTIGHPSPARASFCRQTPVVGHQSLVSSFWHLVISHRRARVLTVIKCWEIGTVSCQKVFSTFTEGFYKVNKNNGFLAKRNNTSITILVYVQPEFEHFIPSPRMCAIIAITPTSIEISKLKIFLQNILQHFHRSSSDSFLGSLVNLTIGLKYLKVQT